MNKYLLIIELLSVLSYNCAYGSGREVVMKTFMVSNDKESSEPSEPGNFVYVKIKMKCAGANLRHIGNPLARDGLLSPKIVLTTPNGVRREFKLNHGDVASKKVEGWIANSSTLASDAINHGGLSFTCTSAQDKICSRGSGTAVRAPGSRYGYINIKLPVDAKDIDDLWTSGKDNIDLPNVKLTFEQSLTKPRRCAEFRGHAGNLTFNPRVESWDASGHQVTMVAVAYGEQGYCGGYHSPLLLYFDNDRAQYTGISSFGLFGSSGQVYWPEKGNKAFFLGLDRNHNGLIDNEKELFGNMVAEDYDNGFEALKDLDTNHDGRIDKNDKDFSKLVLWNDVSGKGRCKKKDLFTLAQKGVESISLDYTQFIKPHGGRAEERAEATFVFNQGPGKREPANLVEGKIIDVWFSRPSVITSR